MSQDDAPVYYSDYLQLDRILSSQTPMSLAKTGKLAHDEVLFIIVHQTYELWFKQILHETDSIIEIFKNEYVEERQIGTAVSRLRRIIEIQKLLIEQIRILETMTPLDFLEFRTLLAPASGFQSVQFRILENKLGLTRDRRKGFDKREYDELLSAKDQEIIRQSEKESPLFTLIEQWLERTPFIDFAGFNFWEAYRTAVRNVLDNDKRTIQDKALNEEEKMAQLQEFGKTEKSFEAIFNPDQHEKFREKGLRRLSHKATQAALLINLYRDEPILQLPFNLLTSLIELDELFTAWRYRHALMAQRMIGSKLGTGGSSGHSYLRVAAESHKIFADFTNLSTFLIPRSKLPELPEEVRLNLGFYYSKKAS